MGSVVADPSVVASTGAGYEGGGGGREFRFCSGTGGVVEADVLEHAIRIVAIMTTWHQT